MLLSITKLQNLKAIHNKAGNNSFCFSVVINHKTTKFESNSQLKDLDHINKYSCYQSQNYKIWKQFTTPSVYLWWDKRLLSITKLQNLKAIHNSSLSRFWVATVVINHKTTKFESNSQQRRYINFLYMCCYQSQNYKIWKQFTTNIVVS